MTKDAFSKAELALFRRASRCPLDGERLQILHSIDGLKAAQKAFNIIIDGDITE